MAPSRTPGDAEPQWAERLTIRNWAERLTIRNWAERLTIQNLDHTTMPETIEITNGTWIKSTAFYIPADIGEARYDYTNNGFRYDLIAGTLAQDEDGNVLVTNGDYWTPEELIAKAQSPGGVKWYGPAAEELQAIGVDHCRRINVPREIKEQLPTIEEWNDEFPQTIDSPL